MVAATEEGRRKLMDFVTFKELEQPISRPSSTEVERAEAASQALRPDEEILEARERESDSGFPAPLNQGLTAEEQAEFYKVVFERMRRKAQEEDSCHSCTCLTLAARPRPLLLHDATRLRSLCVHLVGVFAAGVVAVCSLR
jgi:hypothetical protein